MKDLITKPANFSRIEFWGATTIFVFSVFFLISDALHLGFGSNSREGAATPFDYYFVSKLIRYTVLYLAFLLLNFKIVPQLTKKQNLPLNLFITLVLFVLIGHSFEMVSF